MARVSGKNIILSPEETALFREKDFEVIPNGEGVFLLIEKEILEKKHPSVTTPKSLEAKKSSALEEEKQQLIGIIKKAKLTEIVEGKFELTLNEKQKQAFKELLTEGKVFVFKLNESYKKGVYRVQEENFAEEHREKKDSENANAPDKEYNAYTLKHDGFLIIRGKDQASQASHEFESQIKEGLLRGIKSFDGNYYLIQTDLLEAYINKAMSAFAHQSTQTTEELTRAMNASKRLTTIVCEFLKDEGEVLEKKKGTYRHIK